VHYGVLFADVTGIYNLLSSWNWQECPNTDAV